MKIKPNEKELGNTENPNGNDEIDQPVGLEFDQGDDTPTNTQTMPRKINVPSLTIDGPNQDEDEDEKIEQPTGLGPDDDGEKVGSKETPTNKPDSTPKNKDNESTNKPDGLDTDEQKPVGKDRASDNDKNKIDTLPENLPVLPEKLPRILQKPGLNFKPSVPV